MPSRPPVHKPMQGQFRKHEQDLVAKADRDRGSSWARGYRADWDKLRDWYARQHPLCEHCLAMEPQRVKAMDEVDHIKPFHGVDDPLRLDPENLQSLCKPCHSIKTAREDGGFGRPPKGGTSKV